MITPTLSSSRRSASMRSVSLMRSDATPVSLKGTPSMAQLTATVCTMSGVSAMSATKRGATSGEATRSMPPFSPSGSVSTPRPVNSPAHLESPCRLSASTVESAQSEPSGGQRLDLIPVGSGAPVGLHLESVGSPVCSGSYLYDSSLPVDRRPHRRIMSRVMAIYGSEAGSPTSVRRSPRCIIGAIMSKRRDKLRTYGGIDTDFATPASRDPRISSGGNPSSPT